MAVTIAAHLIFSEIILAAASEQCYGAEINSRRQIHRSAMPSQEGVIPDSGSDPAPPGG
jgi:hypothetical protein